MNPNAPEFQPPSLTSQNDKPRSGKLAKSQDIKSSQQKSASLNNLKNAWSNPIKSVFIAQCPKKNQETEAKLSLKSDKPRVIPQPLQSERMNEESDGGWATVGKKGKASDNVTIEAAAPTAPQESEEELEVKRQQRRERRKREKEAKKIKKEQEKVKALRAAKDTKVKVVDANLLRRAKGGETSSAGVKPVTGKLSFFDEEYPTLDSKRAPKREYSIKATSTDVSFNSTDTGSEWETEDESDEKVKEILKKTSFEEVEQKKIEVVQSNEPKSFSSILKRPTANNPVIEELSDLISCPRVLPPSTSATASQDVKKVKKKDPITFDIFAALKKKPTVQKSTTVLGSKLKSSSSSSSTVLRNALDSSAPTKRRGKEREKPKRKKPTTMKKLIMSEREARRTERQLNLALSSRNPDESKENQTPEKETSTGETEEKLVATEEQNPIVEEEKSDPQTIEIPEQTPLEKAKLLLHSRKFRK